MSRRFYPIVGIYPPNTIIGGMASEIPTRDALATRLNIPLRHIRDFVIVGSDVNASIRANYSIPNSCFRNSTLIKSFIDLGGFCVNIGQDTFYGSSIENAYIPAAEFVGVNNFRDTLNFLNADYGGVFTFGGIALGTHTFNNSSIPKVKALNATNMGGSTFLNSRTTEVIGGKITSISTSAIQGSMMNELDVSKITSLDGTSSFRASKFVNMSFDSLVSMGMTQGWRDMKSLKTIKFPVLESMQKNSQFNGCSVLELFEAKKCKSFGDPSVSSTMFSGVKAGGTYRVNIFMKTANAGALEESLNAIKAGRTIEFYNDDGTYNSTL